MTTEISTKADDEFRQRMQRGGDLGQILCEHLWSRYGDTLSLGGEHFEMAYAEEVPGYEDEDEAAVLLRRKSDGKVFEAEIDVTIRLVLTPEERAAQVKRLTEMRGQLPLPGVPS